MHAMGASQQVLLWNIVSGHTIFAHSWWYEYWKRKKIQKPKMRKQYLTLKLGMRLQTQTGSRKWGNQKRHGNDKVCMYYVYVYTYALENIQHTHLKYCRSWQVNHIHAIHHIWTHKRKSCTVIKSILPCYEKRRCKKILSGSNQNLSIFWCA